MKKLTKALFALAALVLLLCLLPRLTTSAEAATYSGTCGENLTWELNTETGELTISGTGEMRYYDHPTSVPWCSYRSSIKTVTIGDGITSIGSYAFCYCESLDSATIGNSVTEIGDFAFYLCDSLTRISMPNDLTNIGDSAFYFCDSLERITIPDGVTTMGNSAFCGCSSLSEITIPDSMTSIGSHVFSECTALTSVTIGNSVTSIGDFAFEICSSLSEITIPDSVTTIGIYAFSGCTALTSVTIGDGLTSIGAYSFQDCSSLAEIQISEGNRAYACDDLGVVYSKDLGTLVLCPARFSGAYTVLDGVTSIETAAFYGCVDLIDIAFPDSLTVIGSDAFSFCSGLTRITVGSGVREIGKRAFRRCTNLTDVTIPEGVEHIAANAFECCEKLTHIEIPNSVTFLGDFAFMRCTSLKKAAIGNSVTTLSYGLFDNCKALVDLTLGDSVSVIFTMAFSGCASLKELNLPDTVTTLGYHSFYGCTELQWLKLPAGVTVISDYAFDHCSSLCHVLYTGTEEQWNRITVGEFNDCLLNVTRHYKAEGDEICRRGTGEYSYLYCTICNQALTEIPEVPFEDIGESDYYYAPILWAVERGITNGTSSTAFSPEAPCTRGQIVTFLWRAFGSPEPAATENPFTDVPETVYYYKAILWAVEQGITTGTSATTFSPEQTCTRGQVATFLWRACGSPGPKMTLNPFTDVPENVYYYRAILWAVENGITNGTGNGRFSPEDSCTRGQIVTFLYRALAE